MTKENPVQQEIERLLDENGGTLPPRVVVEAARPETSVLHKMFDWEDSEAAEKWRLHQARQLIRVCVTVVQSDSGRTIPHRVFVNMADERKDRVGYRRMVDVMADADYRQRLLLQARAEMKAFRVKYAGIEALAGVFSAMEEAEVEAAQADLPMTQVEAAL